jgi:hypothetical protein
MAKFRSPFNTNTLSLTQTYHTGSNNTAIDLSATADTPVYAIADGPVTYRSSGAGSYCIQQIDNSDLKVYYVHTYRWVGANTYVKKGQIVCYIAPTSLNGGYPTHLHLGLPTGKGIMDYFDRSLIFTTNYADIKAIWFKNGSLNWSLFKDLSYNNTPMSNFKIGDKIEITAEQNIRKGSGTSYAITGTTKIGQVFTIEDGPRVANGYAWYDLKGADWVADVSKFKIYTEPVKPPTPPEPQPCEEYQKLITTLNQRIGALESISGAQKAELEETKDSLSKLQIMFDGLQGSYNILEGEKLDLQEELSKCKLELQESKTNFIKKILDAIKGWLDSTVG